MHAINAGHARSEAQSGNRQPLERKPILEFQAAHAAEDNLNAPKPLQWFEQSSYKQTGWTAVHGRNALADRGFNAINASNDE